jgi:murein endopeptidase
VESLADDGAIAHQHTAHAWIRVRCIQTATRQFKGTAHVADIVGCEWHLDVFVLSA